MSDHNTQDLRDKASLDIFANTGYKVESDDPFIDSIIICKNIVDQITTTSLDSINNQLEYNKDVLESYTNNIVDNLKLHQTQVVGDFDSKLAELNEILSKLENQKEAIVADVYVKLQQRITEQIEEQLSRDLQAIANNANNKVNNERNILKGGVFGLIIGIALCAFLAFIFTKTH